VYEAHPTSGIPYTVYNWKEFNDLYAKLLATKSIASMKDIWWDIRPSPVYGTLELRICDGPATMLELQSIVAFIHLLALWFDDNRHHFYRLNKIIPEQWVMRENKWRAIRYGLDALIISHETLEEKRLRNNIELWLVKLEPYITQMKYQPYIHCLRQILAHGNSASRQRKIMSRVHDINQVVAFNMREFDHGKPIWN
jgi:carboxylate-amine ligase